MAEPAQRVRMTGQQRRAQLLDIGRNVFSELGYEATSIEEIAERAGVSKPIVYEHFGGKAGLYTAVVDREMTLLQNGIIAALKGTHPKVLLEQAAVALLTYIEEEREGFRILVRDPPAETRSGSFTSLIGDIATRVEHVLAEQFSDRGYETAMAPLYAQALVGAVAQVGRWWLDAKKPSRKVVAAHLVNLTWNGLGHLEQKPRLGGKAPA